MDSTERDSLSVDASKLQPPFPIPAPVRVSQLMLIASQMDADPSHRLDGPQTPPMCATARAMHARCVERWCSHLAAAPPKTRPTLSLLRLLPEYSSFCNKLWVTHKLYGLG